MEKPIDIKVHNSHKNLLWKMLSDTLPTGRKLSFDKGIETRCFCGHMVETVDRLFLHGPLITVVWFSFPWNFKIDIQELDC